MKRVCSRQASPLENSPVWHVRAWLSLTFPAHPACPEGQGAHGPLTQIQRRRLDATFVVGSGLGDGLLKGCRRNEKKLLFADGSALPCAPALGSRIVRTAFGRAS
jgi:hypothetical protein